MRSLYKDFRLGFKGHAQIIYCRRTENVVLYIINSSTVNIKIDSRCFKIESNVKYKL